jgi:hypothetical protein
VEMAGQLILIETEADGVGMAIDGCCPDVP